MYILGINTRVEQYAFFNYLLFYLKNILYVQVHHGQPGGDVHGAADAVQQDVRHGPGAEDG